MASTIITCAKCSKKFKGKEELRGKKIRCPFCKEPFRVATEEEEQDAAAAALLGVQSAETAEKAETGGLVPEGEDSRSFMDDDEEEEEGDDPYGVTEVDLWPRCPHCAARMATEKAIICLKCGYNTQTRRLGETEKKIELSFQEHIMHLLPAIVCVIVMVLFAVFALWADLVLPRFVHGDDAMLGFMRFADSEAWRLGFTVGLLFDLWAMGFYAFNKFVLHPKPEEQELKSTEDK